MTSYLPCPEPGCSALTHGGPCPGHLLKRGRERGHSKARGYGADWQRLRAVKLAQDPICEMRRLCQGDGATEVHHQRSIADAPHLRLSYANLMSVCGPCHDDYEQQRRLRRDP